MKFCVTVEITNIAISVVRSGAATSKRDARNVVGAYTTRVVHAQGFDEAATLAVADAEAALLKEFPANAGASGDVSRARFQVEEVRRIGGVPEGELVERGYTFYGDELVETPPRRRGPLHGVLDRLRRRQ